VVNKIFRSQQWQDQRQRQFRFLYPKAEREGLEQWDFLTPIVADGDMGFGGLTHTMKMTRAFVEAGVAMFHLDDLAIGMSSVCLSLLFEEERLTFTSTIEQAPRSSPLAKAGLSSQRASTSPV
jgi:hypothetical protein